jgi:hypothetical protein
VKNPSLVAIGVVATLLGTLFFFQGLGYVKGSFMTDSTFWAVAGPIIAVAGIACVVRGLRHQR